MTITLCGENTYAVQQTLANIGEEFVATHGPHSVERLDAASLTPKQLQAQLSAVNLFAPQQLCILAEPSSNKELFAELGDIAAETGDHITLVIVEGVMDKRTKTYKTLRSLTDFREFSLLSEGELQKWLMSLAAERGGQLSPALARQLIETVGRDQWQLTGELDKLLAFNPTVTKESITQLVVPNLETSAFALLDAALAGRSTETQRLLGELKMQSDPYEFFGLLVWQVHALAVVASAPTHLSAAAIASETGLKPFVAQKTQGLVRRLGHAKVQEIVEQLATLDMQLKSTGLAPWLLLEQSLHRIANK